MSPSWLAQLVRWSLVRRGAEGSLLGLCEQGALAGGLSVALDVKPDEAFGALCAAVGGRAKELRVLDVRNDPFELVVRFDGHDERWDVPDLAALAHNLNDLLKEDPRARAVAVLGEWEDALQLWCVPKERLEALFRLEPFAPLNEADLRALADSRR